MAKRSIERGDLRITYDSRDPGLNYLAELFGVDDESAAALIAKGQAKRKRREAAAYDEQCPPE